tara:strand:+ start:952 stop:1443 length:492 start_codon:yes stop_codon:yes gene_type:complete
MKNHVLKINSIGDFKQESLTIPNDICFKYILEKKNSHLLYWWEYDLKKYEAYGSIEQDDTLECNVHKLPINGLSEFLEENSNTIDIYGDIIIIKYDNNLIVDLTQEEYLEFYQINNICDVSDDSEDLTRFDEEIKYEKIHDLKQITSNVYSKEELDIDNTNYI